VDREQADHVGALLLGHRLELRGADGVLLGHEPDESLHVGTAQLLVRASEPRELAQVRIAAAAVPLGQHGKVVIVVRHDLLAQALEAQC